VAALRLGDVVQNISAAIDNRYFESNVSFSGTALPASTVGSRPLTFRYAARMEKEQSAFAAFAEYSFNLSGGRANDGISYAAARAGAEREWEAYRYGLDATYSVGARWSLVGRFRGQYAHEPLIPGEQLGISGMTAVRGFREREVTGDRGYYGSFEANGPPVYADIAPFIFYDFGGRTQVTPVIGSSSKEHISSAGAGLRWKWRRVDLNVSWAHVLEGVANGTPRDHDKLHFSAFYRF
jgi:hemolysin activation/secretion protein